METGKTTRYFKYAIGEIILVVIGILIALQINNWNEDQKNKRLSLSILNNLNAELKEDSLNLESNLRSLERRKECSVYLNDVIKGKIHGNEIDSSAISKCLMRVGFIYKFVPSFAVYNEVQNSSNLNLIKSDSLKIVLADYRSQVEENIRIEGPYEGVIKDFEKKASVFLTEIKNSKSLPFTDQFKLKEFNIKTLNSDKEFLELLNYINYLTSIEIALREDFLMPDIIELKKLIKKELNQ